MSLVVIRNRIIREIVMVFIHGSFYELVIILHNNCIIIVSGRWFDTLLMDILVII